MEVILLEDVKSEIIISSNSRSFAVKLETGIGFNPFYMFGVVT